MATRTLITNIGQTSSEGAICIRDFSCSCPDVWHGWGFLGFFFFWVRGSVCVNRRLDAGGVIRTTFLQEKVVIGVAYDCVEKTVYWTEITSPSISKASIEGGDPESVILSGSSASRVAGGLGESL